MKALGLLFSSILTLASCLQLEPTYRSTSKRIVFGEFLPGSSHVNWVLPWLDELAIRGHNVTFITIEPNLKFGVPYPRIKTLGVNAVNMDAGVLFNELGSHPDPLKIFPKVFELLGPNWRPSFDYLSKYIKDNEVDVLVCDHMSDPCIDAALFHHLPFITTSTLSAFPDAKTGYINNNPLTMDEFTTLHQSIPRRFYNTYLLPLMVLPRLKPHLDRLNQIKRDAGILHLPGHDQRTQGALKIVSTLYGMEPARPMGPLIEMVGPVLSPHYPDLDLPLQSYLDARHKVAYVAFGQHARPDRQDVTLILTSLIQQVEKGHLDGILWSSRFASLDSFPTTLVSPLSKQVYNLTGLFMGQQVGPVLLTPWSPQFAVLLHPAVSVFLSHGGSNSLVESLYAGKRLLFFPFFGDQLGTANHISLSGLSVYFGPTTPQAVVDQRVESVVVDREGSYQANVNRYQAMIQIHSQTASRRAADLVEEVAFTATRDTILHREDIGQMMSWIKRTNLDIHGLALVLVVSLLGLVYSVVARSSRRIKQKIL